MQFDKLDAAWRHSPMLDPARLFTVVRDIAAAPSPSGSAWLPGGAGDVLEKELDVLGLQRHFSRNYRFTHNGALHFGAARDPDLVITAHLDKPGYGVASLDGPGRATLFPCCAVRFGREQGEVGAISTRFDLESQRLVRASRGRLQYRLSGSDNEFSYVADEGEVGDADIVTMYHPAERMEDIVRVNSLDDAAGVTALLGTGSVLGALDDELRDTDRSVLLAFTDHEEWPLESTLFGLGAMRLGNAIRPPSVGAAVIDTHPLGPIELGRGLAYGFDSSRGRGATVPLDARAIQEALDRRLSREHPRIAQRNRGYFSRSDDFGLMRWTRTVGLFGIPVDGIHDGAETCSLQDIASAVRFLSAYVFAMLGVVAP